MKRGAPLQRRTPLQAERPLQARSRLKATPTKRRTPVRSRSAKRPKGSRVPAEVVAAVKARSGGTCERCGGAPATELHHRLTRARGGPDDAFNLVDLCHDCHHVHAHGENEWPWLVPGSMIRGVYTGSDEAYRRQYPPV